MFAGHLPAIIAHLRRPTLLLAAALLAGVPAWAAPNTAPDAMAALLAERDIVRDADRPGLIQSVRDRAADLVLAAFNFLDVPYRFGGNNATEGFDCSGFTRHIFAMSLGLMLPRRSDEQANASSLVKVESDELRPGDLVFFNTLKRAFSHVGIYIGEGRFIHSPRSGSEVRIENMRYAYWANRFDGARRAAVVAGADAGDGTTLLQAGR
jgi:cell wall-associated NlpC family hydrolase